MTVAHLLCFWLVVAGIISYQFLCMSIIQRILSRLNVGFMSNPRQTRWYSSDWLAGGMILANVLAMVVIFIVSNL